MLTLWGAATRRGYCDGLSRRSFLKVGGLVMGGLNLPGLLEAEAMAAADMGKTGTAGRSAHQSVIMVYLGIDPHGYIRDKANRPVNILPPTSEVIRELT